jgi:hypothetical protein
MDFISAFSVSPLLVITAILSLIISTIFWIIALVKAFRMGCVLGLVCLLVPFAILIVAFIKREEMLKPVLISFVTGIIFYGTSNMAAQQIRTGMEAQIKQQMEKQMPAIAQELTKKMQEQGVPLNAVPSGTPKQRPAQTPIPYSATETQPKAAVQGQSKPQSQPVIYANPQEQFVKSFYEKLTVMSADLNKKRPQPGASAEEIQKFNADYAAYNNMLKEYKRAVEDLNAARAREAAAKVQPASAASAR